MTTEPPSDPATPGPSAEHGDDVQFRALEVRTAELIGQHFDLFRIVAGPGVVVTGADNPVISLAR